MFKQILVAAAVAVTLSGGMASAKESAPASEASSPSDKTRYCIKSEPVTGTILSTKTCKTLAQWKALGYDPTQKQR